MSDGAQSKINDSKSWIFSIQHFTSSNRLGKAPNQKEQQNKQIQYVIASTFDNWLSLKCIEVQKIKWIKIYDMKMSMPVVKSFIEFNQSFEPQGIVLAYFDGSLDYCPWPKIQKYYCLQIQAGKKRKISKTLPQIIQQTQRFAFINTIFDNSMSVEEAFMLETICFLYKKNDYIYALNFKGELKILKVVENERKIKLIQKIDMECRILKAECLIKCEKQKIENIIVAVCFQNISTPFVFEISSTTTKEKLHNKLKIFCQNISENGDKQIKTQIKLMVYDPSNKLIITCMQSNEIGIFSFEHEQSEQNDSIYTAYLQKLFSVIYKDKAYLISDIDVKDDKLVILCKHSFYIYDLREDFMIKEGQKLTDQLQIGKLVSLSSEREKPLFLVKKMFNYSNPQERKSTTLHLFIGK